MTDPPNPGDVIRYAYLWYREAELGQEEGLKDRPCVVVLAVQYMADRFWVTVAPVTHAQPPDPEDALELPIAAKRRFGLDDRRSWIILTEANRFAWPGPDVTPIPDRKPRTAIFGQLSNFLFQEVRLRLMALSKLGRVQIVKRTE